MKVTFLDLKAQYAIIKDEIVATIRLSLTTSSNTWMNGRKSEERAPPSTIRILPAKSSEKRPLEAPKAVYKNGGDKNHHIHNQYTITSESRDRLRDYLKENGIETEI